jgi:DNA polymerase-3 subunit gamma/tau
LLKTLEEQPARTITCLCTTNPEKIPQTILSRVQTFQLSKISLDGINSRLKYIIEQENKSGRGIVYDDDAVLYIAKMSNGGMRDAITLLDKALSFSNDVTLQSIQTSLGLPNYDDYFELLNAIAKKDNEKIVSIINSVYNSGVNFVKWFDGFFSFIINIVKFIYLQDINQTMIPVTYQDKIAGYGTAHSALCLKLSNKLVKMNQELKTTQYLQELAISYLCTPPSVKKG